MRSKLYTWFFICTVLALFATDALAVDTSLPDRRLTPGEVLTTDTRTVCVPGYSATVRHTSSALKREIRQRYYRAHPDWPRCSTPKDCEIDHLIPLSLGGADTAANLWPEPNGRLGWMDKDKVEWRLHQEVCAGRMDIKTAQGIFKTDWRKGLR